MVEKIRKRKGWIFWGCFTRGVKGPYLFQEKEQGLINKILYYKRIVPLIYGWIRINPYLYFIQDRVPSYLAASTKEELSERGIITIFWPVYLLDLNLIKTIQNQIKDYIKRVYSDKEYSYNNLRIYIKEAQEQITEEQLNSLIDSIRERCLAVINAEGGFIKF